MKVNVLPKLQKALANTGIASRRSIEDWIKAGRIKVNGKRALLGMRVSAKDQITIDNKKISLVKIKPATRVLLYHKPEGEVCTRQDEKRRLTVFAKLPKLKTGRWIMIGRLDLNTSGLLLFTNDGELAQNLMHPKSQIEREYLVRVHGKVTEKILQKLQRGVLLNGKLARFNSLKNIANKDKKSKETRTNQWYKATVKEGRNRIVRRIFESQNLKVSRLSRIRFHKLTLPRTLVKGKFLELSQQEIDKYCDG